MKNRFKLAKEMLNAKMEEAKSGETRSEDQKSQEKPTREKTKVYIKKPPRYVGLIFILAGLSFFYFLTGELRSIWECRNWPTVPGMIMSSKVVETDRMETNTLPNRKGMVSRFVYLPTIAYNYTVEGKKYRSNKVFLWIDAEDFHKPDNAREIVDRYQGCCKIFCVNSKRL